MATPMVSGIAALALAKEPHLSAAELRQIIINAADRKPGLPSVSNGRANAAQTIARTADRDQDGKLNSVDACPDAAGNTPSGCPDSDGDGVLDLADACPGVPAATRNGCPLPGVRSLRVRIRRTHGRLAARIRVVPTSAARAVLRLQRRVCRRHHCRYRRVALKRFSVPARGRTVTVRGRHGHSLARGRYRVLVTLSSGAGTGPRRAHGFRVR
jgi:hypothetical protein